MDDRKRIQILNALNPNFRVLRVYNSNSGRNHGISNSKNVYFASTVVILTALTPFRVVLSIWHLMDTNAALQTFIITVPVLITVIQSLLTLIGLTMNNREIDEMISRIQSTINQRRFLEKN